MISLKKEIEINRRLRQHRELVDTLIDIGKMAEEKYSHHLILGLVKTTIKKTINRPWEDVKKGTEE
jgi:hypothetical protein